MSRPSNKLSVSRAKPFKLLFSIFISPFTDRSSEEEGWNISLTIVECSTAGARTHSRLDYYSKKDVFAHEKGAEYNEFLWRVVARIRLTLDA